MIVHHAAGDGMVLFEGNQGSGAGADNVHGTHQFGTYFRNRFFGEIGRLQNTETMHLWAFSRFFNVVGNVLGRTGYYTTYESDLANNPVAIYGFGTPDTQPTADPLVKDTLLRWGNYDTVNGVVRWDPSDVPHGLSQYANPVRPHVFRVSLSVVEARLVGHRALARWTRRRRFTSPNPAAWCDNSESIRLRRRVLQNGRLFDVRRSMRQRLHLRRFRRRLPATRSTSRGPLPAGQRRWAWSTLSRTTCVRQWCRIATPTTSVVIPG